MKIHELSSFDPTPLLPTTPTQPKSIVDILPKPDFVNSMYNLLNSMMEMRFAMIQWSPNQATTDVDSGLDYEQYLQFPNAEISALASTIVSPMDSNDEKMYKIEQWVQDNITYVSDEKNYGTPELWAYPTMTLEKRTGDCEDGAFLMHSLALSAGVPYDRIRTYGGLVYADEWGLTTGGHAWTAYQRETDDEWIIMDWCYWAKDTPLAEREPMSEDKKYIDDFFFIDVTKTVETPYENRVRYASFLKGIFRDIKV